MAEAKYEIGAAERGNAQSVVEFARNVHADALGFNAVLYSRAQIVLTLDGVLLAALSAGLASSPDKVTQLVGRFAWHTWMFLAVACVALLGSVLSATGALYSHHRAASLYGASGEWPWPVRRAWCFRLLRRFLPEAQANPEGDQTYWNMWFYGRIARMMASGVKAP